MLDFTFCAPTEIVFGRGAENAVGENLRARGAARVLLHFGGQSAEKSGLLPRIRENLRAAGLEFVELGGVEPNPKLSLVRRGVALALREKVDFILAVGGGSVLDSAKGIGMGAATGRDPWEFARAGTAPEKTIPLACVLTLSASGSEMSNSCVLTNDETWEKRGIASQTNRPAVSFLNPELTYSVSPFQTGCGIVDIMMHTLERYLTLGGETDLTDRIAEGVILSVRDAGRRALQNPNDYEARAALMWAGCLSHNNLTECGRQRLFPVHKMEHEFSALHDEIAHGAGLSVLFPAWADYVVDRSAEACARMAKLAGRVFDIAVNPENPATAAHAGVRALREYFEEIGMPVRMAQIGIAPDEYGVLAKNTVRTVGGPVKSFLPLDDAALFEIFKSAE